MSDMVTINVDGVDRQVPAGETLIQACLDTGSYIPHFCYHPRMEAVGMCRQCMVEVESPRGTMLVPSCTMPVNDGMVVHTQSETVKKVQEGMLEFLLLNHPLDCPVCDRGGECPLQDQTMACRCRSQISFSWIVSGAFFVPGVCDSVTRSPVIR